jgi:type I restriction enzyme S subunit
MTTFPKYERYKNSCVEWLGEVPEHWEVEKGKWLFVKMERPVRPEDDVVTAFRDGQVTLRTNRRTEGFTNAIKEHGYQGVRKGDLVINAMDAPGGAIGVSESDGKSTPVYSVCVPRKPDTVSPQFYAYLLRYTAHSGYIATLAKGIRERSTDFRFNDFGALGLPLPPKPEQDRIVAFLDRKTAEIDALIAKKQRQIELLDEQKAILINRAVTRGLNPNAKLKPSGIEWIGEIPEHWEVLKLRRLLSNIEQGNSPNAVQENGDPNQWKVITLSAVSRGVFRNDAYKPISSTTAQKEANTLAPGDLLLTRANTRSLVGDACIVESVLPNTTFSDLVYRFQLNSRANSKYLLRYLLSNASRSQIERDARGSNETMCKVSHGHIKEWDVALPPMKEQLAIVSHLERLDQTREGTIGSLKSQIQSLKTLRSSLIAHAVTGRIKV